MTAGHWTEDELIARLYGVGPDNDHIETCAECSRRLKTIEQTRAARDAAITQLEPDFEFLAAQRRKIYQNLSVGNRRSFVWRLAPALAMCFVLVLGFVLFTRNERSNVPAEASRQTDTQLVEYVGGAAMDSEPAAVAPLEGLFEE
jgi:anti-sigma factor RsiW